VLCNFGTYPTNGTVLHPTRLQGLILMFGGFLVVKICSLLNTERSLLELLLKLQDVEFFQFTYMGEQYFWLRVKGLISLSDLQSILNKNSFEKKSYYLQAFVFLL
jgi:hypothetical protein